VKNIVSIKEASGDLEQMAAIITATDKDFLLYTGDDANTLPAIAIGAHGVVSVASHVIGNDMKEMIALYKGGKVEDAANLHRSLLPTMKVMFVAPNPTCVKYALKTMGMDVGGVRLPLTSLSYDQQQVVIQTLQKKR
jgi:4-hydroxy-tetrahydrodipicolinate synthase